MHVFSRIQPNEERIPAEHMLAEFDLGWVHRGGAIPVDYVPRYAGRVPLVHIKDFGSDNEETDLGKGQVDFQSVFEAAEASGIRYYIVEQEAYAESSLASFGTIYDSLLAKYTAELWITCGLTVDHL